MQHEECTGIYLARCVPTNKVYVGSALRWQDRCRYHRRALNNDEHPNPYFQNAWNKYGEDNFVWEFIEKCTEEELLTFEQKWINFYKSAQPQYGYNIANPVRQRVPSARMSARHKAYWNSLTEEEFEQRMAYLSDPEFLLLREQIRSDPTFRKNLSDKAYERWSRPEFKSKRQEWFDEYWGNPETRELAVAQRTENALTAWNGNTERRKAVSEQRAKDWQDPAYVQARTQGTTELWKDPEYRAKVSSAVKKGCNTPEYLEGLRARTKAQWAKRKAEGKTGRLGDE